VVSPSEVFTAGDYSRAARNAIAEISARNHLPIVVGGSGLYLRALLEGLFPGPPRSEELRQRLRQRAGERGSPYLHRMLQRLDPDAGKAIHPNDLSKIIRALEVCIAARKTITQLWQRGRNPLEGFHTLRLGLNPDREALYERINSRARQMFENGLVEETKALLDRYGGQARALDSLGYKQAGQYLRRELELQQAITLAQQGHRNYAKRQMTWFRREPDVHWFSNFGDDPQVQKESGDLVIRKTAK
jgi:tRNA dimethylallyltransferase